MPPRRVVRLVWRTHRALYRVTRGRLGLWRPRPGRWGAMRLTTVGRRSGIERSVILGYFEDGPRLVTLAMNGWGEGDPAWWLNLRANPEAVVELAGNRGAVLAHTAEGDERARLWAVPAAGRDSSMGGRGRS
ncbi:nitroreductase/quinone reductase family protein [Actinoplanes sp. NPDC049596]